MRHLRWISDPSYCAVEPPRLTSLQNWQWDGLSDYSRPRKREAAWLNIKAGEDSTISYTMPMVVIASTYEPLLEVHLDTIAVSTSLNDIRVLTAETCRVSPRHFSGVGRNAITTM